MHVHIGIRSFGMSTALWQQSWSRKLMEGINIFPAISKGSKMATIKDCRVKKWQSWYWSCRRSEQISK